MLLLNELLLLQNRELMGGSFTIFLALSLSVGAIIHVELRVHQQELIATGDSLLDAVLVVLI
jgi:hypothetical protein